MGINRKINRNRKSPIVEVFIETTIKSILSSQKQSITLYSYNRKFVKNAQDLLIKFNIYFTQVVFELISQGKNVHELEDYVGEILKNNSSTMILDYIVEDDRILFQDKVVGFNIGKLLFDDYIVYFAGPDLFFEDTKTKKRYFYSKEILEKEVA